MMRDAKEPGLEIDAVASALPPFFSELRRPRAAGYGAAGVCEQITKEKNRQGARETPGIG